MSFLNYKETIEDGDLVFAWLSRDNVKAVRAKKNISNGEHEGGEGDEGTRKRNKMDPSQVMHTKYGVFPYSEMVGKRYGTQMAGASKNGGFIYLLSPSPELWTISLPHRTQIVYTPDASYIIQRLEILPGDSVIEAGTGSGSFTHQLARTVGKGGKVFSYEFHHPRYQQAIEEITQHGLEKVVENIHGDVCHDGFIYRSEEETPPPRVSAIFLDLPSPWEAIPHATQVADRSRQTKICCFSPCIEQVTRTVEALSNNGWRNIEMVEVSCRRWTHHKSLIRDIDSTLDRLRNIKRRRIEGIQNKQNGGTKRSKPQQDDDDESMVQDETPPLTDDQPQPKLKGAFNPWGRGERVRQGDPRFQWTPVSRSEFELKSHTSYLTFAYLPPQIKPNMLNQDGSVCGITI